MYTMDVAELIAWRKQLSREKERLDKVPDGSEREIRWRAHENETRALAAAFEAYSRQQSKQQRWQFDEA
jgi:hypothetical protein